jgi:hypothetical protein
MGNSAPSASHDEHEDDDYAEQFDGIETLGYRVLGVQPNSPGETFMRSSLSRCESYGCIAMSSQGTVVHLISVSPSPNSIPSWSSQFLRFHRGRQRANVAG